mmetsp:Transcript_23109/g.37027  ORF Transcript_23109/g.37027 Transcript_23109/m.37027 type:complete len:352 (-) Transcript_23109:850-1905(-)
MFSQHTQISQFVYNIFSFLIGRHLIRLHLHLDFMILIHHFVRNRELVVMSPMSIIFLRLSHRHNIFDRHRFRWIIAVRECRRFQRGFHKSISIHFQQKRLLLRPIFINLERFKLSHLIRQFHILELIRFGLVQLTVLRRQHFGQNHDILVHQIRHFGAVGNGAILLRFRFIIKIKILRIERVRFAFPVQCAKQVAQELMANLLLIDGQHHIHFVERARNEDAHKQHLRLLRQFVVGQFTFSVVDRHHVRLDCNRRRWRSRRERIQSKRGIAARRDHRRRLRTHHTRVATRRRHHRAIDIFAIKTERHRDLSLRRRRKITNLGASCQRWIQLVLVEIVVIEVIVVHLAHFIV